MDIAKNTRQKATVLKVVDMNRDKNDALNVNCLLSGKDYGVLVVAVY